jgi:hypothetical protein
MDDKNEADALIELVESERIAEISEQLRKLKSNPFSLTINIMCIIGLALFYLFFIPPIKDAPNFVYIAMFVIGVAGIASAEGYRANKRIDLIAKLLKIKYNK